MVRPAIQVVAEFLVFALENFEAEIPSETAATLRDLGLDLADLCNALAPCEVIGSNKLEAEGVTIEVRGSTTEGDELYIELWVCADRALYRLLRVSRVGERR